VKIQGKFMPYNTNNTVPSSDLRDFYDNAQTLDDVVNSGSSEATTRTGKKVKTLTGIQEQVTQIGQSANQSAQSAAGSAAAAAQSAAEAAGSAAATGYVAPPFPDVWAPLSDDLKMISGYPVSTKLLSFTRASTATYIDKSGVLQTAAINEARFEKQGLLIEGQSSNGLIYSGDLTNSVWTAAQGTKTPQTAPDGSSGAVKFIPNATAATHVLSQVFSATAGQTYTMSIFVKAAELTKCIVLIGNFASQTNPQAVRVDMAAKTAVGTVDQSRVSITELADGWFRVSCTATVMAGASNTNLIIGVHAADNSWSSTSSGDGASGFYVWGGQIENTTSASSYIPTLSSAVTRAADDCSVQRSGNDNYFGPVTIAAEVHCNGQTATDGATSSRRGILAAYPTTNDNIILMVDSSSSTAGKYAFAYGSAAFNYSDNRIDDGQTHTVCSRSTTLQNQSCVDGTQLTSPTPVSRPAPGTTSSVNQLFYIGRGAGATASGSRMLNGHIRNLRIWHRSLSDIQMKGIR